MRIFLTGAQGTGKSTIVNNIFSEYGLRRFDSMSRDFMKKKDDQFTDYFQKRISLYCLNLYVNEDNFICSRSFFDSIAYPTHSGDDDIVDMVRLYEDMLFEDDCIYFYTPIEFEISSGGNNLRVTDEGYQHRIDEIIRREIETQKEIGRLKEGENFFILTGSIDERLNKVREVLTKKGLHKLL